jgi:hypothetical protein
MMVQDRKTGEWYNPELRFQEILAQHWFIAFIKRIANK